MPKQSLTDQRGWQYVVLAGLGACFFLGIFVLIPDDQPTMRSGLIGLLILAGNAAVVRFLGKKTDRIERNTNGSTSRLLDALDRERRRYDRDVSRETSGVIPRRREGDTGEDHQP